jgi:hypothetical protein
MLLHTCTLASLAGGCNFVEAAVEKPEAVWMNRLENRHCRRPWVDHWMLAKYDDWAQKCRIRCVCYSLLEAIEIASHKKRYSLLADAPAVKRHSCTGLEDCTRNRNTVGEDMAPDCTQLEQTFEGWLVANYPFPSQPCGRQI